MTDGRDPLLQSLFVQAEDELEADAFTSAVMTQTRSFKYRIVGGLLALALAILASAWFIDLPLQQFVLMLTAALAQPLIVLDSTWLAWTLAPINTVASVLVIVFKGVRMARKRMLNASYLN
jgi:uncharacterized membrane protein